MPDFTEDVDNKTVVAGREAVLTCHVTHIGSYKVSCDWWTPRHVTSCSPLIGAQGGVGAGGHPDHHDHSQQHHHEEPARVAEPPRAQGVEAAHRQRAGGGQGLVHVPGQHRPHAEQEGLPRGPGCVYNTAVI